MTKKILLNKNKYVLVDDNDYEWLSQWKWRHFDNGGTTGYAIRTRADGKGCIFMHREILNLEKGEITDHVNGDGLDNRHCNLRKCTMTQNNQNSRKQRNNTSGYMGVSLEKIPNKWRARICYEGVKKHIGLFNNVEDAARAYDEAAKKYHEEFAALNFPND